MDVLLLFDEQHPVLTAAEVARRLGMSRSTTYRYLQSLRSYQLVEEDEAGGYRLGPRVFHLARVARQGLGLSEIALPLMRELAARFGEAVLLTRRAGNHVVCVERVESRYPMRLSYERGQLLPLHAGASAKVILAFLAPAEIDAALARPLPRYTERTVTEPERLRADLAAIRAAGYAVSEGEVDPGVRAVAAPIHHASGEIAAGLTVVGPAFRLDERVLPAVVDAVRAAARTISQRLADIE
ncbi:MAG: IclR family transcriptional regulator [Chloroflexi bacterium]|nr:IclR family transcriptional regulator [Chloroflexota bacterium]